MKKLTRAQAQKRFQSLVRQFPELLERDAVDVARRMTKREQQLLGARREGREEGYREGVRSKEQELSEAKKQISERAFRIDALKQATSFLSVAGQTLAEFARAMQSEANQL